MNPAAMQETASSRRPGPGPSARSPVLAQFRVNPFRVLRVPTDVGVDQAIWKAEEILTRLRAGLPAAEPDPLPWLPEPDEQEARQAVQRIEEPLRRLADQLAWFDFADDPTGDLLRRGLAGLDAHDLGQYLASAPNEPNPATGAPNEPDSEPSIHFIGDEDIIADGAPGVDAPPGATTAGIPGLLNQANLRLMLASLALADAPPEGLEAPGAGPTAGGPPAPVGIAWEKSGGLTTAEDVHGRDLSGGRQAARARSCVLLWTDALGRWGRLLRSPSFLAYVVECIARLDDESVGEDDAEAIVVATSTRLTDLLVGELKAQLLNGRLDRVRALLEVASGELDPKRWALAFRPLRPLFRTEVAELAPLLGDPESPRFDDVALYLDRLDALTRRWAALDPAGHLGLSEIGDEAVAGACQFLSRLEGFATLGRLRPLLGRALGIASAESLKQRIAATVARTNEFEGYACNFCRSREMDLDRSVTLTGKVETHRTHGFNSTTIHYMLKANIVPRCSRCCDLHGYLWKVGSDARAALGVALAGALAYFAATDREQTPAGAYLFLGLVAVAAVAIVGYLARVIVALWLTPRGERRYWNLSEARQYREMKAEGCKITADFTRLAFAKLKAKSAG